MAELTTNVHVTYKGIDIAVRVRWPAARAVAMRFLCEEKLPRGCPLCGSTKVLEETYDEYRNETTYEPTDCWCCPYNQQHNRPRMPLLLADTDIRALAALLEGEIRYDWDQPHWDEENNQPAPDNFGNRHGLKIPDTGDIAKGLEDSRECTIPEARAMLKEWETLTGTVFPIGG